MADRRVAIVGAGPCGLACARELERLGHRNWTIFERESHPGGLAASVVDPAGFTWDLGGHVVFSHFGDFDALLAEVMGEDIVRHDRSSYIRWGEVWVPYPFQNNLRHLPADVVRECLDGLAEAPGGSIKSDFGTWMRRTFGAGITRHFMEPYNFKVWATQASDMSADWIAERVSVVPYERAARSVQEDRDDVAWGPNNRFVFPATGGTGEIYRRLAARLEDRIRYSSRLVGIDPSIKTLRLAGGDSQTYDSLISTMPLDHLVGLIDGCPETLAEQAGHLRHNGVYMVGVGYEQPLNDDKSWMYFPDGGVPFYRATNFAKYSAANVPGADVSRYCSYMTETSFSEVKAEPRQGIEERVEAGLRASGVVSGRPEVASAHVEEIPYAYPVPTLRRDEALGVIQPWLEERDIYSRGRFGAWRYEIGNMDHAVKMGVDVARRVVTGAPEALFSEPSP